MNKLVSENALRREVQRVVRADLLRESWESLDELRGASENAVAALEEGVREGEQEIESGGFSSMLEGFFNSLGFVDPCDLVRKDPKEVKTQADELENALSELRTARAENINARLGNFANLIGMAGAGSLTYFAFNNKMNLAKATPGQMFDLVRNTDNDKRNASLMQQAQDALPADQVEQGKEYGEAAVLARIQSMDDAIGAGMVPKAEPVSDSDVEAAAGTGDVGAAAARIVNRWTTSGFDKSDSFPDGKQYVPFQVFLKDEGGMFSTRKYVSDEMDVTPRERGDMRRSGQQHTRAKLNLGGGIDGKGGAVMAVDVPEIVDHPDYKDMAAVFAGGQSGIEALKAAMLKKSEGFADLGYKDPRAFWDSMMNNFTEASAVTQDEDRGFWESALSSLKGDRPTEWQKYYNPQGSAWERFAKNVASVHMNDLTDAPPSNANICGPGMKPGRGGECVPVIEWNKTGFLTAGKYMVIGAAVLHVYKTLLALAPGPVCSLKNFIKEALSGVVGFVKGIVSAIVDTITGVVKVVVDGITGIFESTGKAPVSKFDSSLILQAQLNERLREIEVIMSRRKSGAGDIQKISRKLKEELTVRKIRKAAKFKASQKAWLLKHESNERARAVSLKHRLLSEQDSMAMAQQVASPAAIKAAQQALDPFQDAWEIFHALKGVGTDEGEVERVIRKRLKDLDKLYLEFSAMLKMMRTKKKTFQDNMSSPEANMAALMGGAAYGIYAYTPDSTKEKIKQSFRKVGDKVASVFTSGGSEAEELVQQAANTGPGVAYYDVDQMMSTVLPQSAQKSIQQSIDKAAEGESGEKFRKNVLASLPGASEKDAEKLAKKDPDAELYDLRGEKTTRQIVTRSGQTYEYMEIDDEAAASGAPGNAGDIVVGDPAGDRYRVFSSEQELMRWFEDKLKDPIADVVGPLDAESGKRVSEAVVAEQAKELMNSIQNVARFSDNPTIRDVGKHLAYAGAIGMATKTATAAAMTWWDGVGLNDDLVKWLEDDGMDDEAELVRQAIEKAGINTRSNRSYDRGY